MNFWRGKRVAITGAGGTVGSRLTEWLMEDVSDLMLIDNSEIALWRLMQNHKAMPSRWCQFADVRDFRRLMSLFDWFVPDVVFHAAALKHVPICEANEAEAVKTNVEGTASVRLAVAGVASLMVLVSTDKAADPVSVMGRSKLEAERLMEDYQLSTRFCSVRFHNVFGSSGSVVDLFAKQIAEGGPVTVTHPDMVRWFSAPQDACNLLLKCAEHALGPDGRTLYALEVGKPIRIMSLAHSMIGRRDIHIEITGMRPGERLEEKLIADDERRVDVGIEGIFAIERAEASRSAGSVARGAQGAAEEQASESEAARA